MRLHVHNGELCARLADGTLERIDGVEIRDMKITGPLPTKNPSVSMHLTIVPDKPIKPSLKDTAMKIEWEEKTVAHSGLKYFQAEINGRTASISMDDKPRFPTMLVILVLEWIALGIMGVLIYREGGR